MDLFSMFGIQVTRVKSEPPDTVCLPEQGQVQQQYCSESSLGGIGYSRLQRSRSHLATKIATSDSRFTKARGRTIPKQSTKSDDKRAFVELSKLEMMKPHAVKKSKDFCCVPQCTSARWKDGKLSFHRFPRENEMSGNPPTPTYRRKQWIARLRIGKKVSNTMVVCSKHFADSDFFLPGVECKLRRLKSTAVPSQNVPRLSTYDAQKAARLEKLKAMRLDRRTSREDRSASLNTAREDCPASVSSACQSSEECDMEEPVAGGAEDLVDLIEQPAPTYDDKGAIPGMCHIKEEPPQESSNERPITVVKTEPYNVAILTEQDQVGHSSDSASEDAKASTCSVHVEDEPTDPCNPAPSATLNRPITTEGREAEKRHECDPSESARNHTQEHTDKMLYKCDLCPAEFIWNTHLQHHKEKSTREKPYKCELCPAEFIQCMQLQCHKRTHTGEEPYKCDLCPAEFSQSMALQRHKKAHTGERPYKCDLCPAEFVRNVHLQRHKKTHTGVKLYRCDLCLSEFSQLHHLKDHIRIHTGEKPYKCSLCPAEFTQSTHLQYHKWTHKGEKPYKCNLCSAEFVRSADLQRHKKTHTGEKPYKCDLCPAEFTQNTHLQCHKRTHTGEKPYKCDLCPAQFIRGADLQRHRKTHTGEKPYKCDLCPAEFTRSTHLQRHKKAHTGEKPYKSGSFLQRSVTASQEDTHTQKDIQT
ncbi:zinc finger protein 436-like isoform X1 [Ornithodoros turicata]|uniref:zinc finger protein 436-like isoform X1 n=1 Tax=Ornithodoros turicata TaxID=34597 RepID=UPI003138E1D8